MDLWSESLKDRISYMNSVSSLSRLGILRMAQERRNIREKSENSLCYNSYFSAFSLTNIYLYLSKTVLVSCSHFLIHINIGFNVIGFLRT